MVAPLQVDGPPQSASGSQRFRVAVELTIDGDLRYLSHHDTLRLLTRALVRANWGIAYSHGFNPLPQVRLPLPRNVGIASTCELALVDLDTPAEPGELSDRLAAALPPGCTVQRIVAPAVREMPQPQGVTYELDVDAAVAEELAAHIAELLARESVCVQRDYGPGKPARTLDIRPYIAALELEAGTLRMTLQFSEQRTARPAEVLAELGLAAVDHQHRLRRTEIRWNIIL